MKLLKFLLIFIVPILIVLPAFSDENITTKVGNNFKIELKSNATTGYQWRLAKPVDDKIQFLSSDYIAPNTNLMGAGGKEIWTFKAVKKGETKICFEYARPWENVKPEVSYTYIIRINDYYN